MEEAEMAFSFLPMKTDLAAAVNQKGKIFMHKVRILVIDGNFLWKVCLL